MAEIINRSYYDAAEKGRQDKQAYQSNALANRINTINADNGEYVNALMRDPNTTLEQFARAGRSDIANSLQNLRGDPAAAAKEFATQMTTAIRYAKGAKSPKAVVAQFPMLVETFGPGWDTATDDQIREQLEAAEARFGSQANIAPEVQKPPNLITTVGADGRPVRGEDVPGARVYEKPDDQNVNEQLVTRPAGPGLVQDFAWNPRSRSMAPVGQPYKPATTHTGNPTEGERGAANYFDRMQAAERLLDPNFIPTVPQFMASRKQMEGGPLSSSIANKFLDERTQKYYQAAADWVRAKLRKESGAAIGVQEMEQEIKTYFPLPGDTPAVVAQKAAARQQAIQGMRGMGGRAVTDQQQGPVRVSTPQEAMALPSGTQFVTPDGRVKVRP